jgi:hypothetical protein
MADLLECVIQIKALADTPRRLAVRLQESHARGAFDAGPTLRGLLLYESWLQDSIEAGRSATDAEVAAEPVFDAASGVASASDESAALLVARFASLRAATIRTLDTFTAAQLSSMVLVARRGRTTVADLVALALAHDTDAIAQIVNASC